MKKLFFIILSLISFQIFGHHDSSFLFNEFSISANRTNLEGNDIENRTGFGIGAYHNFMSERKVNIIFGFEYNRTSYFNNYMYYGHFSDLNDITYHINSLSIPTTARLIIGRKIKYFMDAGVFFDLHILAKMKGTMYSEQPYPYPHPSIITTYELKDRLNMDLLNVGPSFGIGLQLPVKNFKVNLKADYKHGIIEVLDGRYGYKILNRYFRVMIGLKI